MGSGLCKHIPEVRYQWTFRAKNHYNDTVPVVSGDGSTIALYSRGERKIIVLDRNGSHICDIPVRQRAVVGNVSAIPSLSFDGSKVVTRDAHSVCCYTRTGQLLWEYERRDKVVRSGMQSWIAQISGSGNVVIVRQFKDLIFLDGNTGALISFTQTQHQMANSIPRISHDGSIVVCCDGTLLRGFVNTRLAWTAVSPVKPNGFWGDYWSDPSLSRDGSTCAVIGKNTVYLMDARNGAPKGTIDGVIHRANEYCTEVSLSDDGTRCAVTLKSNNAIAVYGGPGYTVPLLMYQHHTVVRPLAPLLSGDGRSVACKIGGAIAVWHVNDSTTATKYKPVMVARVADDSKIPGGPTVHSRYHHHDRDTFHKRTFTCSYDGSVCVAIAKHKEIRAFGLQDGNKRMPVPVIAAAAYVSAQNVPVAALPVGVPVLHKEAAALKAPLVR